MQKKRKEKWMLEKHRILVPDQRGTHRQRDTPHCGVEERCNDSLYLDISLSSRIHHWGMVWDLMENDRTMLDACKNGLKLGALVVPSDAFPLIQLPCRGRRHLRLFATRSTGRWLHFDHTSIGWNWEVIFIFSYEIWRTLECDLEISRNSSSGSLRLYARSLSEPCRN